MIYEVILHNYSVVLNVNNRFSSSCVMNNAVLRGKSEFLGFFYEPD